MAWRPLITDARSAAIAETVREIVAAIDATPPSGAFDHGDRGLLRAYAAEADVAPDPGDRGSEALAAAVTGLAEAPSGPALFGGAAGIGWRVAHLANEEDAALVCDRIDAALIQHVASGAAEYDLIAGVTGFGVYALARGDAGRPLAAAVLDEIERTALPRRGGLALHTPAAWLPPWQQAQAPHGYWNLGVAHGMTGVAAMLARFVAAGVEAERAGRLLDGVARLLFGIAPAATGERFTAWLAGPADAELPAIGDRRGRLAWCYHDLGASIALLSVAQVTGNAAWRDEALAMARVCAARPEDGAQIHDAGLCHGALGAAHLFNRLWQATGEEPFADAARRWLDRGLAMRSEHAIAGFPAWVYADSVEHWVPDPTLLSGAVGVALALHAMITPIEPMWDQLLLADLELAPDAQSAPAAVSAP